MHNGYELRTVGNKDEGVFSLRHFKTAEIVMVGKIKEILSSNDSHASQIAKGIFARHTGDIPKVNHSCGPNCGVKLNESGAHDFVARRDITVGEEITFDYAMRNYIIEHFPLQCACGADNCRGQVTGWKDLSVEQKKHYDGFAAPYLHELDTELKTR
ncbi:nuclear protein SET [[Leptolyngbya] sp. PCC 7376]|uniref:SET domain-containing protein-lysine N-methyltransferase n=1 Tax=[Leptolyngbya] sp. PCC 7376 TaxID=111781 RepID=UPI00029F0D67|nr:SET domain-containing protein [[Leptolyngbya] sp. PCC 7376]AFY40144.1 nuclear protein SET [[Leptolyngbya] sp. PCC 7376]